MGQSKVAVEMKLLRSMRLLLLLGGDVETNPGPPKGSPAKRVKPPTEKEIMEGRVTSHEERLDALEKLVKEQKVVISDLTKTQVELKTAQDNSKVELEESVAENKVLSTSLDQLKVNLSISKENQVGGRNNLASLNYLMNQLLYRNFVNYCVNLS